MDQSRVQLLVSWMLLGEVYVGDFLIKNPTAQINSYADRIYWETISKHRFDGWLRESQKIVVLARRGLCSLNVMDNLKKMDKRIDELKLSLYRSYLHPGKSKKIRKELAQVRVQQEKMRGAIYSLDHATLEGYAEVVRREYVLGETVYFGGEPAKLGGDDIEFIMGELARIHPTESELREVARTDPWTSYWAVGKPNPTNTRVSDLSPNQRTLISLSRMYDSVREHTDSPPPFVINDDDLLDGWMLDVNEKAEKDRRTKLPMKGAEDAQEIFIKAESKEEAQEIDKMNTFEAVMAKKQRKKIIEAKGRATDLDFPDVRVPLQAQANQEFMSKVKGKK